MREIKFRAWDTKNKTWTYVTLGDLVCGACTNHGDKPLSGAIQIWYEYTGLKDKNGKEIYEGDIVKADGRIYEVAWFEKDGGWFCFRENDSVYTPLYHLKSEVIGNIHENHDLIEKEEQ